MFQVYAQTRYERNEQIGKGEGMNSIVFRAFDPYLQREIAVKEIDKAKFGNDFDRYCAEARTMAELADPNVVPIIYVCETPDHIGLALPYFPAGSLVPAIKNGPLDQMRLLRTSHDIFSGVSRIHTAGFVHLDLKPSNILFDFAGRALVADFGQTRRVVSGSVKYPEVYKWSMPPEVWENHVATVESDIYQLGVLLYRAANGEPVYAAQKAAISSNSELMTQIRRGRFPDRKFFLPHIPQRVRTILRKAMKVDPTERYHSVSELGAALGRVPLTLDWSIQSLGGGAYRWFAKRDGSPTLEVELSQDPPSEWQARVWTQGQERRAKGRTEYWRESLSYADACAHLTDVFAELGQ